MNNMVVLDSKNNLFYCIKKYVLIIIFPTISELFKNISKLKWNPLILMHD
jgi:hypothetical protein